MVNRHLNLFSQNNKPMLGQYRCIIIILVQFATIPQIDGVLKSQHISNLQVTFFTFTTCNSSYSLIFNNLA